MEVVSRMPLRKIHGGELLHRGYGSGGAGAGAGAGAPELLVPPRPGYLTDDVLTRSLIRRGVTTINSSVSVNVLLR